MSTTKPSGQYTTYDLWKAAQNFTPMVLNGHVYWVNPQRVEALAQRIYSDVPTLNGVGRFTYGVQSIQYNLQGFTGNAGLSELTDATKFGGFRPDFSHLVDQPFIFTFPARNIRGARVYVNYFRDWIDQSMPNYYQYEIRMSQYPPTLPPYTRVLANLAAARRLGNAVS